VKSLLSMYLSRFKAMLSAGNRRYIQTLLILIEAFLNRLTANDKSTELKEGNETVEMLTINDFLFSLNIDNINMFKLCEYMKSSKIIHKVRVSNAFCV
jgi:chromosome transmission fidelity protein 1